MIKMKIGRKSSTMRGSSKDVTNRVESEEDWIAVANAESFSIYVVVTTTWTPDTDNCYII